MLRVVRLDFKSVNEMTRELNDACENGRWIVLTATATGDEMVYVLFNYQDVQPDPDEEI